MLTAVSIGNFKAFAETQRVAIRPITLIFGANSAGKSSLIHSLLLARHASERGELDTYRTDVGGESVDLGGFRQYVYRHDPSRQVVWSAELDTSSVQGPLAEMLAPVRRVEVTLTIGVRLDDQGNPVRDAPPEVTSCEFSADGKEFLRMSRRAEHRLRIDRLDRQHPVFRDLSRAIIEAGSTVLTVSDEELTRLDRVLDEVIPELGTFTGTFLPTHLVASDAPDTLTAVSGSYGAGKSHLLASLGMLPVSQEGRENNLANVIRLFLPLRLDQLVTGLSDLIQKQLAQLRYLGPLRSYPPRHLAFAQNQDGNWYAGGGYAWDVVRRDPEVRAKVNEWLSSPDRLQTPYELVIRELVGIDQLETPLAESLRAASSYEGTDLGFMAPSNAEEMVEQGESVDPPVWVTDYQSMAMFLEMGVQEFSGERISELLLVDRRTDTRVSHRDVGIGISQVLPVLVMAYASQDALVAIEQPEIHLHPALQAELGDVFINSALGDRRNTFLLETHSEHVILRVMRRMRETADDSLPSGVAPVRPDDVSILFVQPGPDTHAAVVRRLELDEDGRLLDPWPGGFFEEGFRERFGD